MKHPAEKPIQQKPRRPRGKPYKRERRAWRQLAIDDETITEPKSTE